MYIFARTHTHTVYIYKYICIYLYTVFAGEEEELFGSGKTKKNARSKGLFDD
jgi:hypothetical protein